MYQRKLKRSVLVIGLAIFCLVMVSKMSKIPVGPVRVQAQEANKEEVKKANKEAPLIAEEEEGMKPMTLLDLAKAGGPIFIVLIFASLAAVTIVIERFFYFREAAKTKPEILLKTIRGTRDMKRAIDFCSSAKGIIPRVFKVMLQSFLQKDTPEHFQSKVEVQISTERTGMNKLMPQLDTLVTMCPLLGLLGTVTGMIRAFSMVAMLGMARPEMLAGGISEALVTTATGLIIAIPALIAFNYFTGKREEIFLELERGMTHLQVIFSAWKSGAPVSAPQAPQSVAVKKQSEPSTKPVTPAVEKPAAQVVKKPEPAPAPAPMVEKPSGPKTCPNCKAEVSEQTKFCPNCGAKIT